VDFRDCSRLRGSGETIYTAGRRVFRTAVAERLRGAGHDSVAPVRRRVARKENHGAGIEKVDARNEKVDASMEIVGASTEMRIASPKTFAASSEKDDASAEKIE